MESSSEKSVRLPTFDGMHKNFQVWWMRFMACATVCKFSAALKIGGETDSPQKESDTIDMSADCWKVTSGGEEAQCNCNC